MEQLDYPSCEGAPLPEGEVLARGHLRSGPTMREQDVVEHFELRQRGCVYAMTVRQEWALGTADIELLYDLDWLPIRVWKRTTMPGASDPVGRVDIRRYELRTQPVGITRRGPAGSLEHFVLHGGPAEAVITPGRGSVMPWIRRADLPEGGRTRIAALDIRESIERIRDVTLQRLDDREVEGLGRVRVYTIYGREPIYTDEDGVVVGDLFGLRPHSHLAGPGPEPRPSPGPLDPVGTP